MTTIVIHYTAPGEDPLKVPRPHTVDLATGRVEGGECDTDLTLVGLSRQSGDGDDRLTFYPSDWMDAGQIEGSELDVYAGWFANFTDPADGQPFTFAPAVDRVEVLA